MKNILVIDDDRDLHFLLKKIYSDSGFAYHQALNGPSALEILSSIQIDLVLCDLNLRKENGRDILVSIKEQDPSVPVIIITGYSNVQTAVEVIRLGALDYLLKPLIPAELIFITKKAFANANTPIDTPEQNRSTHPEYDKGKEKYILSPNKSFQDVLKQIDLVAPTDFSVIIYGESGSGKEAFAQEIHKRSKRKAKPFLAIDCGALSKELSNSILFGHEKGAFTGAIGQKIGAFENAHGGTVFLDEISNLPYESQVSLLRVMQERKVRRVGGTTDISINVRIIVASNKKLWELAQKGEFREDLFHRFNEFSLNILPLRERKEDILFYANHFTKEVNKELNKDVTGFTPEATDVLLNYNWPGNLRELKNLVKRTVLISEASEMGVEILPAEILSRPVTDRVLYRQPVVTDNRISQSSEEDYMKIIQTLKETGFNKKKTGGILNMDIKTLNEKIKVFADLKKFKLKF